MFWSRHWSDACGRADGGSPPPPGDDVGTRRSRADVWGLEPPTTADRWVLRIVYGFVAADQACSRCGAPLGRGVRVVTSPTLAAPPQWQVTVVTSCRGWRRHPHAAHVVRPAADILLGSFHPGSL